MCHIPAGEVVLFTWAQCLADESSLWAADPPEMQCSAEVVESHPPDCDNGGLDMPRRELTLEASSSAVPAIAHGEPFTEKKSTFQVVASPA